MSQLTRRFQESAAVVPLAHLATVLWLFWGALFEGRLLFFRDFVLVYAPNYDFLSRALRSGLWPLWNPGADAGAPFLVAYPVDLVLTLVGGFHAPLSFGAAFHVLLAMCGASVLARTLGMGRAGAWVAGAVFGLGGFLLSLVNLVQLFQAAAWSPWVLAAALRLLARPSWGGVGLLAAAGALEVSTLAVEIVVQTAIVGAFLVRDWSFLRDRRRVFLGAAVALILLASAPAWYGGTALVAGTRRGAGFSMDDALVYSLHPTVLLEVLVPRFFGNVHAFSHVDFWGEPFFPQGFPYLISLYLGPSVLLLVGRAGWRPRLLALAALGILIGLGAYGPLGLLGAGFALPVRGPQKAFFMTALALALLAGEGVERARERPGRGLAWLSMAPGLLLVASALALPWFPGLAVRVLAPILPPISDPATLASALLQWPPVWLTTGALALVAAGGLVAGRKWALLSGVVAVLDLLIVNGPLNPMVEPAFYDLQPPVREMVQGIRDGAPFRVFAYGPADTPDVYWEPAAIYRGSDVALYSAERQSLMPRTQVLDGFEGAYDVDPTGYAPVGSTLDAAEVSPVRYPEHHARLRLANVRYVFVLKPLVDDRVVRRSFAKLREIQEPLLLYELRDPLPRAFWVPKHEVVAAAALATRVESPDFDARETVLVTKEPPAVAATASSPAGETTVRYERLNAHTVRIRARTPPGFVVVLDGYHRDWQVRGPTSVLLEADGRYEALVTPGGEQEWTLVYRPRWRAVALGALAVGLAGIVGCLMAAVRRRDDGGPVP